MAKTAQEWRASLPNSTSPTTLITVTSGQIVVCPIIKCTPTETTTPRVTIKVVKNGTTTTYYAKQTPIVSPFPGTFERAVLAEGDVLQAFAEDATCDIAIPGYLIT